TDGKVVDPFAAEARRHARVPGPLVESHELGHQPPAIDKQVGRDAHASYFREIGVQRWIKAVGEQRLDAAAAVSTRRQGNGVDDDHLDLGTRWAVVEVR